MDLTIQQINQSIIGGHWTNDQLNSMIAAVKYARNTLAKINKRGMMKGDRVEFTSNRNGQSYQGTVEKVKIKYILVRTPVGLFNVPANMIRYSQE